MMVECRNGSLPADDARLAAAWWGCARPVCDLSDEPVTAARNSFDEHGFPRAVAKDLADTKNLLFHRFRIDHGSWPDGVEDRVLCDQPAGVADEIGKQVERFRCKWHAAACAPQAVIRRIEPEGAEEFHLTTGDDFRTPAP